MPVEVTRREALTEQFDTIHLGLDATAAVIAAPVPPQGPTEIFGRPQGFITGDGACGGWLPEFGVSAWGYDGGGASGRNSVVAFVRVIRAVCGDQPMTWPGGI